VLKAKLNNNAEEVDQDSDNEQIGGERFNRLLGLLAIAIAVIGGTVLALGVERSGINQKGAAQKLIDDPNAESRDRGEVADLAAHGATPHQPPIAMPAEPIVPMAQPPLQRTAPKQPGRFAARTDHTATQPNQFAMAGEVAGSAASNQFGSLGRQMVGNGLNRSATIEIRPGYEFTVMVTQNLAFPGPYGSRDCGSITWRISAA